MFAVCPMWADYACIVGFNMRMYASLDLCLRADYAYIVVAMSACKLFARCSICAHWADCAYVVDAMCACTKSHPRLWAPSSVFNVGLNIKLVRIQPEL